MLNQTHSGRLRLPMIIVAAAVVPMLGLLGADVPHTFSNGSVADATEINTNFSELAAAIDGLQNGIGSKDGLTAATAGDSCLQILQDGHAQGDSVYWINPEAATAFQAYCDMTHDGGGFTLVVGVASGNKNHVNTAAVTPDNLVSTEGLGKYSDVVINALLTTDYRLETSDLDRVAFFKHDPAQPFEASLSSHPTLESRGTWSAPWEPASHTSSHRILDSYGVAGSHPNSLACPASFVTGCAVYSNTNPANNGLGNGTNWGHPGRLWVR